MTDLLQLGMLVPAGTAACCVAANRERRSVGDWLPSIVMFAAMVDLSLAAFFGFAPRLPVVAWVAVLIGSALIVTAGARIAMNGASQMAAQRALSSIGMAALLLPQSMMPTTSVEHGMSMAMPLSTGVGVLIPIGALGVAIYGVVVAVAHWRRSRLDSLDAGAMSVSLVVMLLAHLA